VQYVGFWIALRLAMKIAKHSQRTTSQVGMTLLEIMIVLAIIAVVMGFLVGPMVMEYWNRSKVDSTKLIVRKLANESYAQWALATGKSCPQNLKELEKYTNSGSTKDAWGNSLTMLCGENAPEAVTTGFAVLSMGPDGKADTDDDIRSW
jgi:prepilin-type N-terminal cleavage/methylation domain-containing protein